MNKNPVNKEERENPSAKRIEPELETDTNFSTEEQKEIVDIVMQDYEVGMASMADWLTLKEKDLQHLRAAPPSEIEHLNKKAWMSDRNLGITLGIVDMFQAVLLSTSYNPDSIHFKDTEANDVDNRDNLEIFAKWGLGQSEANFYPEVDDFINHRVGLGFSIFKIYWEVKYEWVDKRIPVYSKVNKKQITSYDIKTEKMRFERGVIKNIDNLDDILIPNYGKSIQDLKFLIEILHITLDDLEDLSDRGIILNFDKKKFKAAAPESNKSVLKKEENKGQGTQNIVDDELRSTPIDIYEWYGYRKKGKKRERYRCWVEPSTRTFIAGKPLRKINRSGKLPYVGGPLRRRPGQIRGGSLTTLIAPVVNCLNNNYNQTSDFQYVQNMPFGFANLDEGFTESVYDLEPGKIFDVDGDPTKTAYFPNLTRSLAWSYQDKQFLMEMLERLTGAASYFMTSKTPDTTATRDNIVEEKSQTKFGLWVNRIQSDISEAINMWIQLYQDNAPPNLGSRVLGEAGKKLFKNLSINTLRGLYDAYQTPDITNGSKAFERNVKLWGIRELKVGSIWFDPRVNPRGNWLLDKEAMKAMGYPDPERYLPPQPKDQLGTDKEADNEFTQFMQGEQIQDPPEGLTPLVVEHLAAHLKQKEERYHELDEEYRGNFDAHLFATMVNYRKFMAQVQQEQMAMKVASTAAMNLDAFNKTLGPGPGPATAPGANRINGAAQPPPGQNNMPPKVSAGV